MHGDRVPALSVVMPAHNEEAIIETALHSMLQGIDDLKLQIVVVANGCDDATADAAKRVPGIEVVETLVGNKASALNLGDSFCRTWPRAYVDADVSVDGATLRELALLLAGTVEPRIAAPSLIVDTSASSWLVRQYYKAWALTEYRQKGHIGSGFYALNETGRARFDKFPDLIADDRFVQLLFEVHERVIVPDRSFTISAPRTLRAVRQRGSRIIYGNRQLWSGPQGPRVSVPSNDRAFAKRVLKKPSSWAGYVIYKLLEAVMKRDARRMTGTTFDWNQDRTTRVRS